MKQKIQYLFQKGDGSRFPIPWEKYELAIWEHGKSVVHVVNEKTIKVIALKKHQYARPPLPLKYGGSRRERGTFDPTYSRAGKNYVRINQLSQHQLDN